MSSPDSSELPVWAHFEIVFGSVEWTACQGEGKILQQVPCRHRTTRPDAAMSVWALLKMVTIVKYYVLPIGRVSRRSLSK